MYSGLGKRLEKTNQPAALKKQCETRIRIGYFFRGDLVRMCSPHNVLGQG
jgi:hypothetical protein